MFKKSFCESFEREKFMNSKVKNNFRLLRHLCRFIDEIVTNDMHFC